MTTIAVMTRTRQVVLVKYMTHTTFKKYSHIQDCIFAYIIFISQRNHSSAIFVLWLYLFCVLESNFVLFEPYVRFHRLSSGY